MTPTTVGSISIMTTPLGGTSITSMALAGMGVVTTRTAAMKPLDMPGHSTPVTATPTAVTVITLAPLGTGAKRHGIMIAAVITIITGSKRKENEDEQTYRQCNRVEWTPAVGVRAGW